ncbi:ABC transporter permease [candidate division KSB1 bacterium]|nr:MAG: ABC transporter permease [candidate division KSB1 bacterium]
MNHRIITIAKKELLHIKRDPYSLTIIIILPVIMVILFGYAITFDVKNVSIGILDRSQSKSSRELVNTFTSTKYFNTRVFLNNEKEIEPLFKKGIIRAAIIIPEKYSSSLKRKPETKIQIIIDGSEPNTANIISNYVKMIVSSYSLKINNFQIKAPIDIRPTVWFNPELKSIIFIVPGLITIILMLISALLTSITIAREKENGTLEQILVSPIKSYEIIIGKVIPYIIIAFIDSIFILVASKFLFSLKIEGNLLLLSVLGLIYIISSLGIGLLISTIAKTQQVAMMMTFISTLLPAIMLSGFMFPIKSMPKILQYITYIIPPKYFLIIIRGIILKGIGIGYLWHQVTILILFGALLILVSLLKFKTRLE